jgi:hypothetical protein
MDLHDPEGMCSSPHRTYSKYLLFLQDPFFRESGIFWCVHRRPSKGHLRTHKDLGEDSSTRRQSAWNVTTYNTRTGPSSEDIGDVCKDS